jgi:peptidoglycan-N-acetylglucosamine deacetylase
MNAHPVPRRWRPAPSIWASAALHGMAGVGCAIQPSAWPFALAALAANHAGLTAVGLWPKSRLLGPNITHLNAVAFAQRKVAITFDDGPNPEVTPWVLDQLDEYQVKATFFCVGVSVQKHFLCAREIVKRGHLIQNHSLSHAYAFSTFGYKRLYADIDSAQKIIADQTGQLPVLFRAPAGMRNPLLDPVLSKLGMHLMTWSKRGLDTIEKKPETVFSRIVKNLGPSDIMLIHDGNPGRTPANELTLTTVLPALLAHCQREQLHPVAITPDTIN